LPRRLVGKAMDKLQSSTLDTYKSDIELYEKLISGVKHNFRKAYED